MSKNSLQKNFQNNSKGLTAPPTIHEEYTNGTQRLFTASEGYPRAFYIKTAGDLVIRDAAGSLATYPTLASQVLLFENATELTSSSTSDAIIQW